MIVSVNAVGVLAPGLPNWARACAILRGDEPYVAGEMPRCEPDLLQGNERRRTTSTIRLALQVAHETITSAGHSSENLRSVFACSGGDTEALDRICMSLASPGRPVSPGQFNNSVHNAPAGYWSIATGSRASSTSLCAYDASFTAGLLDAATVVSAEREPVLLVAYDTPAPAPLLPFRPLTAAFACALLLTPEGDTGSKFRMALRIGNGKTEDRLNQPDLERLRTGNPAARSLPLLAKFAAAGEGETVLPYFSGSQVIAEIQPW